MSDGWTVSPPRRLGIGAILLVLSASLLMIGMLLVLSTPSVLDMPRWARFSLDVVTLVLGMMLLVLGTVLVMSTPRLADMPRRVRCGIGAILVVLGIVLTMSSHVGLDIPPWVGSGLGLLLNGIGTVLVRLPRRRPERGDDPCSPCPHGSDHPRARYQRGGSDQ